MTRVPDATTFRHWTAAWQSSDGRSAWAMPEPWVIDHANALPEGSRILDLGAGIGRHALALAEAGHQVTALDAAEMATAAISAAAFAKGLNVTCIHATMLDLPFEDASFDHVLAWDSLTYGDEAMLRRSVLEIARVLRPKGTFMATVLSARRLAMERALSPGQEVSRNTWIFEGPGERIQPRCYWTATDLVSLLWGFEVYTLFDRPHQKPGSWHWHLLAERMA